MGGLIWLAAAFLLQPAAPGLAQTAMLGVLIPGGIAAYGLLLALFGVISRANAAALFRR
jgi:hypothetical protein